MADPATITLAVKAAIAAATDKRTWKAVGVVIAAILTPFILIIVMIMSLLSGTADHNNSAVDLSFHGGSISSQVPAEYRQYIEDMRVSFSDLDDTVSEITPIIESGSIDSTRMKSIFYSLYFGAENLRMNASDYRAFVDCFVRYEERTVTDEDGNETEETYTVAVPITDLNEIYANLESSLGRTITEENKVNAAQIYSRVLYGHGLPRDGSIGEDEWFGSVFDGEIYTGGGDFASPLGANWRSMVTSEFGWRPNPFGGGGGEGDGPGGGGLNDVYMGQVMLAVRPNWSFTSATRLNLVCVVRVKVNLQGEVEKVDVTQSSGNAQYDSSAANAIWRTSRAGAFPPPPSEQYTELDLVFTLNELMGR